MSELLEYRVKYNQATIINCTCIVCLVGAAVLWGISYAVESNPSAQLSVLLFSSFLICMAGLLMLGERSMTHGGYARAFFEWVNEDYTYPPLEEWKESLEERDMFTEDL